MEAKRHSLVILDGVPGASAMTADFAGRIYRAVGPLEAARVLSEQRPEAVLINGEMRWQLSLCANLPPERRPAVLAVSESPVDPSIADEWMRPRTSANEWLERFQLGVARARLRRQSARRSSLDFLTGLPNRRSFVRGLVREAARAKRTSDGMSLVLIDLDDFKSVNELHGHAAGDRLLSQVGHALRRTTRESELVGRIGGDEFALAIPGDEALARRAALRMQRALAEIRVGATISVCERHPGEHLRELYRRADRELMAIKVKRREQPGYRRLAMGAASPEPAPRTIPH